MAIEQNHLHGAVEQRSPTLAYLFAKNESLKNNYTTPDGKYAESCAAIAYDIAGLLLLEGKKPTIVSVEGKTDNPRIRHNAPLVPIRYKGAVTWGGHQICVCGSLVYDPMVGEPVHIEEYPNVAFGTDVDMETLVSEDEIEDFIKNWKSIGLRSLLKATDLSGNLVSSFDDALVVDEAKQQGLVEDCPLIVGGEPKQLWRLTPKGMEEKKKQEP